MATTSSSLLDFLMSNHTTILSSDDFIHCKGSWPELSLLKLYSESDNGDPLTRVKQIVLHFRFGAPRVSFATEVLVLWAIPINQFSLSNSKNFEMN